MKTVFKPVRAENIHPVTKSTDADFLLLIQRAALLALKDSGTLNEMQYRHAEQTLLRHHRDND